MKYKRIIGIIALSVVILSGLAYHMIFGYVIANKIDDKVVVLQRKNIFSDIGANIIIFRGEKEAMVIDLQLPPLASLTRSKIEAILETPVKKVIITHWHPDHSGGISAFSEDTEIIAHKNVVKKLSKSQQGFGLTKPGSYHQFPARTKEELPNKPLESESEFMMGKNRISIIHYPNAHTDGDLTVFLHNQQIVALGDLIWPGSFPFIDVHNGGSVAGLQDALQNIIDHSNADYLFIPGHGSAMELDDLIDYLDMIKQTSHWVESKIKTGRSLEEIISAGFPADQDHWGSQLVPARIWIKVIHDSYVPQVLRVETQKK